MPVRGVGVDLVHVPAFAEQLARPGSRFADVFSVGERAEAVRRGLMGAQSDRFWAARWAAREAFVKAWSTLFAGQPPPYGDEILAQVEVVKDAWDRPRLVFREDVLRDLESRGIGAEGVHVSLSHDGDYAIAYVTISD